jgi:hypothetical protein
VAHEVARVAAETAGATMGALVGYTVGGYDVGSQVGAIAGAAVTPFLERWASLCIAEFGRRGPLVVEAAAASSGLPDGEVLECVVSDPRMQPLVSRILEAVAHTDSQEKLRLFGTVLGEAISNRPNRLDEAFLIVGALDELEAVHLRVMEVLEQEQPAGQDDWSDNLIAEQLVGVSSVGRQGGLAALVRHGLVMTYPRMYPSYGLPVYELSDFGRALLHVMRKSAGVA